jgi:hypothetical protein
MGKKSWASDLTKAVSRLPFHCPALILTRQTSDKDVEDYSKLVQKLMLEWLQGEIDTSDKLYLLHGRRKPRGGKRTRPSHFLHAALPNNGEDSETSRGNCPPESARTSSSAATRAPEASTVPAPVRADKAAFRTILS